MLQAIQPSPFLPVMFRSVSGKIENRPLQLPVIFCARNYLTVLFLCTYRAFLLFTIYLYQQMHIYKKILHYITNGPTYFGAYAPSSGSFDIAFAKVIKH